MPRKRIIDPEFFIDEKMAKLDYKTRLLYIGLWTLADDYGILENNIEKIRIQIFPYTRSSIKKNMEKLIELGRIIPFKVEDKEYLFIENFLKYQWFSHPKHKFPTIPEISRKIQKLLANRTEQNITEHNITEQNITEQNLSKKILEKVYPLKRKEEKK